MTIYMPFYPQYVGPPPTKRRAVYRPVMQGEAGAIMREVAAAYQVSVDELCGPSRVRRIAWPRQELMARLHATERYSLLQIGKFLGGRDHTTVLHGVRAHAARTGASNPDLAEAFSA